MEKDYNNYKKMTFDEYEEYSNDVVNRLYELSIKIKSNMNELNNLNDKEIKKLYLEQQNKDNNQKILKK